MTCDRCGADIAAAGMGTGYGTHRRADGVEEKHCYTCCAVDDVRRMRETGRAVLYLSCEGTPVGETGSRRYYVTNWPGSLVFKTIRHMTKGKHNIAGTRRDVWFTAVGRQWHGVQYGENSQILRCRAVKG